jgi:hypothetical protein
MMEEIQKTDLALDSNVRRGFIKCREHIKHLEDEILHLQLMITNVMENKKWKSK